MGPLEELNKLNVEYVICVNASPYEFNKTKNKFNIIQNRLNKLNELNLIYLNCVGGQDELLFDGNSFITKPKKYNVNNLSFFSGQFISQNIIADFSKKDHIKITRKCEKFPFHRKILEDPIDQRNSLNKERYLIYNLLNGLLLAMKDYVEKNSIKKLFLGLSGGIDSAVVLFIASKIVSKENLTTIMMPSKFTSKASKDDAKKLTSNLGVNYKIIPIQKHAIYIGSMSLSVFAIISNNYTKDLLPIMHPSHSLSKNISAQGSTGISKQITRTMLAGNTRIPNTRSKVHICTADH